MTSVEDRYFNIQRTLLKVIGLWPYRESCVRAIIMTVMYLSALFVQLAVFVTHECTLDIVLKVLSFVFPTICMLYAYQFYYLKSDKMKEIMEEIYYDWKCFKNKEELAIMDYYGFMGKQFAEIFFICLCLGMIAIMTSHIVPITLDIVSPVNVSRGQELHIVSEYFVDPSKYYLLFQLHLTTFVSLGMITLISIGVTLYSYILHICALFKVANYRMEITMNENILRIPNLERENIIYQRIVYAVHVHRRAILYNKLIMGNTEKWSLFIIIIQVVSLSINLFRLLNALRAFDEIMEMFIPSFLAFFHFCYMFFFNHAGQQVINNSSEIFYTIYNLPWYAAPLNTQKLLLFLLQNSNKHVYLRAGKIFQYSYESFAMLTKLSISYLTVIYSIQ